MVRRYISIEKRPQAQHRNRGLSPGESLELYLIPTAVSWETHADVLSHKGILET